MITKWTIHAPLKLTQFALRFGFNCWSIFVSWESGSKCCIIREDRRWRVALLVEWVEVVGVKWFEPIEFDEIRIGRVLWPNELPLFRGRFTERCSDMDGYVVCKWRFGERKMGHSEREFLGARLRRISEVRENAVNRLRSYKHLCLIQRDILPMISIKLYDYTSRLPSTGGKLHPGPQTIRRWYFKRSFH